MKPDRMRSILLSTLTALFFLFPLHVLARQSGEAVPTQAVEDDSTDEVSTLDLFDEDTEKTEQGWMQFYAIGGGHVPGWGW